MRTSWFCICDKNWLKEANVSFTLLTLNIPKKIDNKIVHILKPVPINQKFEHFKYYCPFTLGHLVSYFFKFLICILQWYSSFTRFRHTRNSWCLNILTTLFPTQQQRFTLLFFIFMAFICVWSFLFTFTQLLPIKLHFSPFVL